MTGAAPPDVQLRAEADTLLLGFWIFLMSDAVLFGLAFSSYAILLDATAGGPGPRELFSLPGVLLQTLLLLTSSFTCALAMLAWRFGAADPRGAAHGRRRLWFWLSVTLLLGIAFLGFELRDFAAMIALGAGPGQSAYLSAFFGLVPLHGLHVAAACLWLLVLLVQLQVHGPDRALGLGLRRLALYWHFLDIVWIAIFSLVYLAGLA